MPAPAAWGLTDASMWMATSSHGGNESAGAHMRNDDGRTGAPSDEDDVPWVSTDPVEESSEARVGVRVRDGDGGRWCDTGDDGGVVGGEEFPEGMVVVRDKSVEEAGEKNARTMGRFNKDGC